jgi:replication-associated recombination protein RarA
MDALEAMNDFANNDAVTMTLSGYAGTGKTSLMEIFAKKMRMENKAVAFCASTNKAAAVLKSKVSKSGFKATTVNKLFGINIEVDSGQSYDANNVITVLKDNDINEGTIIVIDEASMVNEENYRILNEVA